MRKATVRTNLQIAPVLDSSTSDLPLDKSAYHLQILHGILRVLHDASPRPRRFASIRCRQARELCNRLASCFFYTVGAMRCTNPVGKYNAVLGCRSPAVRKAHSEKQAMTPESLHRRTGLQVACKVATTPESPSQWGTGLQVASLTFLAPCAAQTRGEVQCRGGM